MCALIFLSHFRESYKEAIDNVSAFNARLCYERKLRAPFLDAQTGIAMNNCHLWVSKVLRRPGATPQYLYSYPARRWRKKKRPAAYMEEPDERTHVVEKEGIKVKFIVILYTAQIKRA